MQIVIVGEQFTFPEGYAATRRVFAYAEGFKAYGTSVEVVSLTNEYNNGEGNFEGIPYYYPFNQERRNHSSNAVALRRGLAECHRLFKWGPNYKYLTHEPPTVIDDQGWDLRKINWVRGRQLAQQGIYMYHYSLLFPWQVKQKMLIYQDEKPEYCKEIVKWAENNYFRIENPYRVHNLYRSPSWLERFYGVHPAQVIEMMNDIERGSIQVEKRQVKDIEKLLNSWWYPVGALGLKVGNFLDLKITQTREYLRKARRSIRNTILLTLI